MQPNVVQLLRGSAWLERFYYLLYLLHFRWKCHSSPPLHLLHNYNVQLQMNENISELLRPLNWLQRYLNSIWGSLGGTIFTSCNIKVMKTLNQKLLSNNLLRYNQYNQTHPSSSDEHETDPYIQTLCKSWTVRAGQIRWKRQRRDRKTVSASYAVKSTSTWCAATYTCISQKKREKRRCWSQFLLH